MQITTVERQKTWTEVLEEMVPGEYIHVNFSSQSAVRGAIFRISSSSDKAFSTKKIKKNWGAVIKITRTK